MYKCQICKTTYNLSTDHYDYIGKQVMEHDVCETIISCPGCQIRRIIGGEHDFDEFTDKDIIMMFGRDLKPDYDKDKNLKEFAGVIQ